MEIKNTYLDESTLAPQRPDFLKIICILSFVSCGLWILCCSIGSLALAAKEADIDKVWEQVAQSNPQLAEVDPITFVRGFGLLCVYILIANIFSLIGVIMMWRLEKLGFFIYAIAELSTHFFKVELGMDQGDSVGGIVLGVLMDLVFIVLYAVNLKHMNKRTNNTFVQSGS